MGCILPGVLHYFIIFYILWVVRILSVMNFLSFTEKTKIYSFAPAKSMGCSVTLSWSSFVPWYLFKCRWGNFMASRRNGSNTKRKKDKARKTPLVNSLNKSEQIQKTNYPPKKNKQTHRNNNNNNNNTPASYLPIHAWSWLRWRWFCRLSVRRMLGATRPRLDRSNQRWCLLSQTLKKTDRIVGM